MLYWQAIVVKTFDDGSKARSFGHALVAGIDRAPLKVTRPVRGLGKFRHTFGCIEYCSRDMHM